MTDLNKVIVVGRITKDSELSYTTGGTAKLSASIACNRSVKKNEQWTDEASFFDVTIWGKLAENMSKFLLKGKQVAVCGCLQQDRWSDKEGNKRSKVYIVADTVQLLGGGKENSERASDDSRENCTENNTSSDFPQDMPF